MVLTQKWWQQWRLLPRLPWHRVLNFGRVLPYSTTARLPLAGHTTISLFRSPRLYSRQSLVPHVTHGRGPTCRRAFGLTLLLALPSGTSRDPLANWGYVPSGSTMPCSARSVSAVLLI